MANKRAIVRQLLAIRELVDGILEELAEDIEPQTCKHTNKEDLTVFGGPTKWRCIDCGYEYQEAANGETT